MFGEKIKQILSGLGNFAKQRVEKSKNSEAGQGLANGLNYFFGSAQNAPQATPTPTARLTVAPTAMPTPTQAPKALDLGSMLHNIFGSQTRAKPSPTPTAIPKQYIDPSIPTPQELELALSEGAGGPSATMAGQIMRNATASAAYKKDPFLVSVAPMLHTNLESSSFKNPDAVSPKNKFGWAPGVKGYNPPNVETVLNDLMSATTIGRNYEDEMRRNPQEASDRMRTSNTYQFFRDDPTANFEQYLKKFAGPVSAENPEAGERYVGNAKGPLNNYAQILDRIMRKRGGSFTRRF